MRDLADQGQDHATAKFLAAKEFGDRCFVGVTDTAPDIKFPRQVKRPEKGIPRLAARNLPKQLRRAVGLPCSPLVLDLRQELSARDAGHGARFLDPCRRRAQIIVVLQRFLHQLRKGLVTKDLPPGQVGE